MKLTLTKFITRQIKLDRFVQNIQSLKVYIEYLFNVVNHAFQSNFL